VLSIFGVFVWKIPLGTQGISLKFVNLSLPAVEKAAYYPAEALALSGSRSDDSVAASILRFIKREISLLHQLIRRQNAR